MVADAEAMASSPERIDRTIALDHEGAREDREVVDAIRGLSSGANDFFEFGLFESAMAHFHRNLHAALGSAA